MTDIIENIKQRFSASSVAMKYIYINVGVFILIRLVLILYRLFLQEPNFTEYVEMPSNLALFARRPWTIITYMFVHIDFLHILFNMLWLYWFGKIFLQFFTGRQLGGLYLLGGLAGGALFILTYNIFPYLRQFSSLSFLAGASASVMAIVFAVSFYRKDYAINLFLIGQIKLIYVALGVLIIDILAVTSDNAGGHIAHIGGALLGIFYAAQYRSGKDIAGFINRLLDRLVNFFTHKPKLKIRRTKKKVSQPGNKSHTEPGKKRPVETDEAYLRRKQEENRIIDSILDKLKQSGYQSLSADEKKRLFDASRK